MPGHPPCLPFPSLGLVTPNVLANYPHMTGVASALLGFCQMSLAAVVGVVVGHGIEHNPSVLPMTVALCGMLVPFSSLHLVRPREG